MAEGGWVVLGAAVGAAGSILTTLLSSWLARAAPDYFDKKAMNVLKEILSTDGSKPWHSIKELTHIVGLSHEDTRQLLLLVGARGHSSGSGAWALISVVGFDDSIEQPQ